MSTINSIISQAVFTNLLRSSQDINASVINLSGGIKSNASVADFSVGSILSSKSSDLTTANINAGQGKSLANTAKNALNQIVALLQDQKSLATKALDASLTDNDRANLNLQFQADVAEINRIAATTTFNNKALLDGTISGNTDLTTATGQSTENYTLLSTSDYSLSGTTIAGNLTTSSVFAPVATNSVGKTSGTATLSFATSAPLVSNATLTVGGTVLTFGNGAGDATALATAFVAAAKASTDANVRSFTYLASGSNVIVTSADKGTAGNGIVFRLTGDAGGLITTATFGGDTINGASESISSASGAHTLGTVRSVAADDITLDANLQGNLTGFTATLDASGTQNTAVFTTTINGKTYTSQPVTLFGTGGYNSKGNTIKTGQVITFYNSSGPTDGSGEFTDNAFKLTVGGSDVTVTGGSADAFQTSLTNIATGFETQLAGNQINQSRSLILPETDPTGGDFTISAAEGTLFAGIKGYDAVGVNAKGDINFVGDIFGTDGNNSTIGPFSFNRTTNKLTTTINGEVYSATLSAAAANLAALTTQGFANGAGSYDSATKVITVGAGTTIVLHSASTTDGKQLEIDLSNLTNTSIDLSTPTLATNFTNDLNTLFGVANNPSLTFQVGTSATDTIGFALNSAKTTALYKDDAGAGKTLDISTIADATQASNVLDNAQNNAIALVSAASSAISSFNSAIVTNNVMINNFDAASSVLLNTDYAVESTLLAEATLRSNAAISVLVQQQARAQNLLKLLGS